MPATRAPATGFCHWCKTDRPAGELQVFNPAHPGNTACKDIAACTIRRLTDTQRATLARLAATAADTAAFTGQDRDDHAWQLAEQIEQEIGADADTAALLAVALLANPAAAGDWS